MAARPRDPRAGTKEPLELSLLPLSATTDHVRFSVAATVFGFHGDSCAVLRTSYIDAALVEPRIGAAEPGRSGPREGACLALAAGPRPDPADATPGTGAGTFP